MNNISSQKLYKLTLISNFIKLIINIIIGLAMIPISLNYWGSEKYGIWLLINSILAYLTMSNLGLNAAISILTNKSANNGEKIKILKRGLILVIISVFILFIIFTLININFPNWILFLGKIPSNLIDEAKKTSIILILFFLLNIPFSLVASIFNGFHKVYVENIFKILNTIMLFLALMLNIHIKGGLYKFAILIGISNLAVNMMRLIYYYFFIHLKVETKSKKEYSNDSKYKTIFTTGIRCFGGSIASLIVLNTDNLVISNFLGVEKVSPYAVTFKIFTIFFSLVFVINSSIIPVVGRKIAEKDFLSIKKLYDKNFYVVSWVGGGICVGSIAFLECLILFWTGKDGYAGLMTVIFLGAYSYIFCMVNLNYIILNTFNCVKDVLKIVWLEAVINLFSSIILIKHLGLGGVALGTFLGAFLSPMCLFPSILKRRTEGKIKLDKAYLKIHSLAIVLPFSLGAVFINRSIKLFSYNIITTILLLLLYSVACYLVLPEVQRKNILNVVKRRRKNG